jgi:hypothetical protein
MISYTTKGTSFIEGNHEKRKRRKKKMMMIINSLYIKTQFFKKS